MPSWRFWRKQLSCRQVVEQVTDYLEGSLSPRERRRFEAHLAQCAQCPEYVEQIRVVIRAAERRDPRAPAPPGDAELSTLYRILRGESGPPPRGDSL